MEDGVPHEQHASSVGVVFGLLTLKYLQMQSGAQAQNLRPCRYPGRCSAGHDDGGKFVRARNSEGYVISVSGLQPIDRRRVDASRNSATCATKYLTLTRDALSLDTPDGKTLPLPSVTDHRAGNTSAIEQRAKVQRDSINYFPPGASRACRIGFFADLSSRAMPFDQVEITPDRACVGRLFFQIPGGITYGQHWLNVKFENSLVRLPFRILTKEEETSVEELKTSASR